MYHSSSVTDARRRIAATHSVELTETGTIVEKKPRAELPPDTTEHDTRTFE